MPNMYSVIRETYGVEIADERFHDLDERVRICRVRCGKEWDYR